MGKDVLLESSTWNHQRIGECGTWMIRNTEHPLPKKRRSRIGQRRVWLLSFSVTLCLVALFSPILTYSQTVKLRVSVGTQGEDPNGSSVDPAVSGDGRYVAYASEATNLVEGDGNGHQDIFVYDRKSGTTTRVSMEIAGGEANGPSREPVLSKFGRYLAFTSDASNLVDGDSNGLPDIFVYDQAMKMMMQISRNSQGRDPNGESGSPAISGDGRYVAYESVATNLVDGDTNDASDIFVYDRQEGTTMRVSLDSVEEEAYQGGHFAPTLSKDGRYVAFESHTDMLFSVPDNQPLGRSDIVLREWQAESTLRASVGVEGSTPNGNSFAPSLNADGRYVVFESDATNLVEEDSNGLKDIFSYDRQKGKTRLASFGLPGIAISADRFASAQSANGRFVAFRSNALRVFENGAVQTTFQFYTKDIRNDSSLTVNWSRIVDRLSGRFGPALNANGGVMAFAVYPFSDSFNIPDRTDIFLTDRRAGPFIDPSRPDVNGDGFADLVWRNTTTGASALWQMNESGLREATIFPGGAAKEWTIRGVGDVTGDLRGDFIWRNTSTGATAVWQMNESGLREAASFPGGAALEWRIRGVGDVTGDGHADLVWANTSTGATAVWHMNESGLREMASFPGGASLDWTIRGVGDVTGDGHADVVWANTSTGATAVWHMNESGLREATSFPDGALLEWVIRGVGDVTGDGYADLVWRNTSTGATAVWQMNGSGLRERTSFPGAAALEWVIRAVSDVTGDGQGDLVWRNTGTGATAVWQMNVAGLRETISWPESVPLEWQLRP